MKEMRVKSLPLKDVIKDLAEEMNTSYTEDCDVYILNIPKDFGKGQIFGINFPSGLGLICYDCTFTIDLEIAFSINSVHPAKFLYIVDGKLEHSFEHENDKHYLSQYQNAIVASSSYNGHALNFKKDVHTKLYSLEIDRKRFSEKLNCSIEKMSNPLRDLLLDSDASETFYHEGGYSLELFDMLRKMALTSFSGLSRQLFLLSTTAGILHQQLVQFELDMNKSNTQSLKKEQVVLVQKAIRLIEENMREPVNIDYLAKTIGTNSARLQHCFKLLYGNTVNGYIKNARIVKAAELLTYSELSVTEVISEVGLINRGYFSKIFKSHYGFTPKSFRSRYATK
ncbi:helix-turn-helix transcriptional regulator [Cryomorpha ignava]|uniref:Helix-turn-helix transcriptional regulator n=1 Tax=Cryomorpha ignava TaxID=101383 RepID=A0A7K3WTH5_9FLAO|nr:AraC family transcriptional regulator [Cryomorpha ignava]NEN24993.1 helix-turn-helix transcriptional regulator [Cryomorpha ignava]